MLKATEFSLGRLKGTIYDFQEVDDILPMHSHTEENIHITIVAKGSFKTYGNGWEKIVTAGNVLDWAINDPHEFLSLEKDSRIVNIIKT